MCFNKIQNARDVLPKYNTDLRIYRSIMEASGVVKEKMMEGKKQEKTSSEDTVSEPEQNK